MSRFFSVLAVSAGVVLGAGEVRAGQPAGGPADGPESPPDAGTALVLRAIAKLGEGANKEVSGIVKSRAHEGVYWTLNDSENEPRVFPVRVDGSVVKSVRFPQTPGVLIGGAVNSDWEDIALDASGRLIVADIGNNSNARADLTLYLIEEPEPTAEVTTWTSKILVRYPDQRARPAPKDDFNFDAEGVFTVGDDIFILSKDRSDTFTKLYRVDQRRAGEVNVLTYVDRFDVKGRATGADCSPDGKRLAVLTYQRVWLFERRDLREPFFSGRVSSREYRLEGNTGASDSESICFENDGALLIADESRGELFRVPINELREVRPLRPLASEAGPELRVMSWNIRYAGGDEGANAWARRREALGDLISRADPDLLGAQEVEAVQADWLRERLPGMAFHGVGRQDGARRGEFAPIMYRAERFTLLAGGHFWLSQTPEKPGSRGWDGACERMASWVRLYDLRAERAVLVVNTHLDHVGAEARARGLELIRERVALLAEGAPVIITGDFNASADGDAAPLLLGDKTAPGSGAPLGLYDTFRRVFPARDADEATFCGWEGTIKGDRIDWIVASPALETIDSALERTLPEGRCPSDHYAVTAILRFAGKPAGK